MEQFYIYIDETGSFSYLDKPKNCFVGGWVCRDNRKHNELKTDLKNLLSSSVTAFNKKNIDKLVYPRDMHFMPLHTPPGQRGDADRKITVKPQDIPSFFEDVFTKIIPKTEFVFRSQGMPVIIPHEQAAYAELLRNTLIQMVREKLFPKNSSLRIVIAHRRTPMLLGYSGQRDPQGYESYLADKLVEELQTASGYNDINITFKNARYEPGLMLADFFCGAMKQNKYLNAIKNNIKKYRFEAGYRLVKMNIRQQLSYMQQHNPVAALMHGIQVYTGIAARAKTSREKHLTILKDIYRSISVDEQEQFQKTIEDYLESKLTRKSTRYDFLDEAEGIVTALHEILPKSPGKMSPSELRIFTAVGLHNLRIASHRGCCDNKLIQNHITFLHTYAGRIFSNRLEYTQHLVDTTLMIAQLQDFNQLNFSGVENTISPVRDLYHKIFKATDATKGHILYDENHAKLEGTYAQMCGFLYDLTGKDEYYQQAEEGFLRDIAACRPDDHAWEQGMGFLTALYWKKGDLKKASEQFCLEIRIDPKVNLYNLKVTPYDRRNKSFFLLHHLYLCALAQREGSAITSLDSIEADLLSNPRITTYPEMLSAKWLAVLFMGNNDHEKALQLVQRAAVTPSQGDGFTIGFVRLPIKMLAHQCREILNKNSNFNMRKEIGQLEKQRKGTEKLLIDLGLSKLGTNPDKWDPYEVASLPPFYFA